MTAHSTFGRCLVSQRRTFCEFYCGGYCRATRLTTFRVVRFNLGNGRLSSTRVPLELAERIFGAPPLLASRTKSGGDAYLVYQCNCLAIALRVAELCTSGDAIKSMGAKSWAQKIKDEFQALDRLQQSLSTTSGGS